MNISSTAIPPIAKFRQSHEGLLDPAQNPKAEVESPETVTLDGGYAPDQSGDVFDSFGEAAGTLFFSGIGATGAVAATSVVAAGVGLGPIPQGPLLATALAGGIAGGVGYLSGHGEIMGRSLIGLSCVGVGAAVGGICAGTMGAVIGGALGTAYAGAGLSMSH